ncbi:Non-specific serine/threonine protein kinase [Bertholletia excelsa]
MESWWPCALFLILLLNGSCALNLDGVLLLSFKYSVLSDPLSVLDNWVYTDQTPCSWTGVTCAQVGYPLGSPVSFRVISLILPNSQLLGSIPEDLGLIQHLRTLDLSNNSLNGTLPVSLFNNSELRVLSLSNNMIYGELPDLAEGLAAELQLLNLSDNALAGKVPEKLPLLRNLTVVSLRSNYFSGRIPGGFDSVEVLDLSSNLFNGSLPMDFGGESLRYLNISYNKLTGSVSSEFAKKIPANASIDLSFNNLTGEIPQSVALIYQKPESFRGNADLCGKPLKKQCTIPSSLSVPPKINSTTSSPAIAAMPKTTDPSSASGMQDQQQQQQNHSKLKPGIIAGIAVGDLAGIGILAMIILYAYQLKKKRRVIGEGKSRKSIKDQATIEVPSASKDLKSHSHSNCSCLNIRTGEETSEATGSDSDETGGDDNNIMVLDDKGCPKQSTLVMVDGETELELETLLKASAYILGSSGSSIVYKAVLADGMVFAVRRIGDGGGGGRRREFESRVRAVAKLRHPNLVRVRGFYWGDDEKLVLYDYVPNGSLASTSGYKRMGSSPRRLPFEVRLKIAKGVARGLTYIHEKKHVHGNIKPSNILLTPDMDAQIADFGLDRLLSGDHHYHHRSSAAGAATRHFGSKRSAADLPVSGSPFSAASAGGAFVGCTSPFHAPESLENLKPSPKWDVYSFGIVLLELLTGRVFSDRELSQWTAGSAAEDPSRVVRMADVAVRADVVGREEALLACFKLGFSCASLAPQKRPSMKEALQVLERLPNSSR